MVRYMASMVFLAVVVSQIPTFLDRYTQEYAANQDAGEQAQPERVARVETSPEEDDEYEDNPLEGRSTRIKADNRGHFVASARLNGRRIEVLVDTGATSVAINKSTARRIGINLAPSDFKYSVSTANGNTKAASAFIDEIEIGRVRVRNVRAAVLDDRALDTVLLGMTFLNELKKFEVSNGTLVLRQ